MQEINEMIKEYDTDNSIVKEIDSIVYNMVDNDYTYESSYGNSETILEALKKLKEVINKEILSPINNLGETIEIKRVTMTSITGDWTDITAYYFEEYGQPRAFFRTNNTLGVTNVKITDLTNNSFKIATIPEGYDITGYQFGACEYSEGSNKIYIPVMFRFNEQDVYAVFNDTSFLNETGKTLKFEISTASYCHFR